MYILLYIYLYAPLHMYIYIYIYFFAYVFFLHIYYIYSLAFSEPKHRRMATPKLKAKFVWCVLTPHSFPTRLASCKTCPRGGERSHGEGGALGGAHTHSVPPVLWLNGGALS